MVNFMIDNLIEKASKYIYDCRINHRILNVIQKEYIAKTEKEAYLIQNAVHKLLDQEIKDNVIGRKIGCTTKIMQDYLNIKTPCAGRIRSNNCFNSSVELLFKNYKKVGVECEIAVSLDSDLYVKKNISHEYLYSVIDKVFTAIEIVDDRYENWSLLGANRLIADDFFGAGCVLGDCVPIKNITDLKKLKGRMYINNNIVGFGTGADIMKNPVLALKWLIERDDIVQGYLPAGSIILLGSMVQTHWLKKGDEVRTIVSEIGESRVKFI